MTSKQVLHQHIQQLEEALTEKDRKTRIASAIAFTSGAVLVFALSLAV